MLASEQQNIASIIGGCRSRAYHTPGAACANGRRALRWCDRRTTMVQFAKTFRIVREIAFTTGCFAQSFQQKLWVLRYFTEGQRPKGVRGIS